MDPLIKSYLDDTFHPGVIDQFERAFKSFEAYQLDDFELPFINMLSQSGDLDTIDLQNGIVSLLRAAFVKVLDAHTIKVSEDTTLDQFNEMLDAFLLLQDLADYSTILAILDGPADDEEKLSDIIAELSQLSSGQAMILIEDFDPNILKTLREFIMTTPEQATDDIPVPDETVKKLLTHYRKFTEWNNKAPVIGTELLNAEVKPNLPFTEYLQYINPLQEEKDMKVLGMHLLSILLLSSDGWISPLLTFRKHSSEALSDLKMIMRVDSVLVSLCEGFAQYLQMLKTHAQ